jgi:hypothetical protein
MSSLVQPAPWRRVKWIRAGQVAALAQAEVALDGLQDAPLPLAFAMLRADNPQVALRLMAQSLPRFEAVRWIAECLGRTPLPTVGSKDSEGNPVPNIALRAQIRAAIADWLADPSDKRRRLVFDLAQAAGFDVPEGAAGLAVFLSGGTMGPPDVEQGVPPPAGAFGQAVTGTITLVSLAKGPEHFVDQLDLMLGLGAAIAEAEDSH